MAESELEMAQRHVAEGEMCILRQRALVEELKRSGVHEKLAADAERLLEEFLALQVQHEAHARRITERG